MLTKVTASVSASNSLAFGEKRSFAPRGDGVEALLSFAPGARVLGVHVQAISAAVDLRSAEFN